MNIHKTQKGFTLIELIVSIAIFIIFIVAVSAAYIDIARAQREANSVREVYSEIRYIFNLIAEEARLGAIDYSCYDSASSILNPNNQQQRGFLLENSDICNNLRITSRLTDGFVAHLALVNRDGVRRTIFRVADDDNSDDKLLQISKEERDNPQSNWRPSTGYSNDFRTIELKNIKINNFLFEISPLVDPYNSRNIACGPVQFQPAISVYTSIESMTETRGFPDIELDLQTSISSRLYNVQTDIPYLE